MSRMDQVNLVSALKEKGLDDIANHTFAVIHDMDQRLILVMRNVEILQNEMEELAKAFPDSDVHGHRLYHQRLIRSSFAEENVKSAVKSDLITKMILFAVAAVATVLGLKLGFGG
jgi:hypothetical protein